MQAHPIELRETPLNHCRSRPRSLMRKSPIATWPRAASRRCGCCTMIWTSRTRQPGNRHALGQFLARHHASPRRRLLERQILVSPRRRASVLDALGQRAAEIAAVRGEEPALKKLITGGAWDASRVCRSVRSGRPRQGSTRRTVPRHPASRVGTAVRLLLPRGSGQLTWFSL